MRKRTGFSLVEIMMVVAIVGVLVLVAVPRAQQALAKRDLTNARAAVSSMFLRGRMAAVQERRPVLLHIDRTAAWIGAPSDTGDRVVAYLDLEKSFGVTLFSTAPTLEIETTGYTAPGRPFVIRLQRGGLGDIVRITGYGRLE